ncbi:hypothetical protein KHP62_07465 [Rhodobacteraceae bacterium NNCM2]|nr:hypothetical protein [Coraliihabitans acroporae]
MTNQLRRALLSLVLLPLAVLAFSDLPYRVFGFINRRLRLFDTFFFVYPASAAYARMYAPAWFDKYARWSPCPIGIMNCGGARGVVFGSLMTESDFLSPKNAQNFSRLMRRMERVAELSGLPSIRMAGILPSAAARRGETFFEDTSGVAAQVVLRAFETLREQQYGGNESTVAILLGGAGLVGGQVAEKMKELDIPHRILDPKAGPIDMSVFRSNAPMILVDIARKGVLEKYLPHLPDGIVVLNETYPEPGKKVQKDLEERKAKLFHIRGVQGNVWPQLPGGYSDAIPCCGAPTDGREMEVRLSQLVPAPMPMAA